MQVASFLQDDRTLLRATSLLAGAMRAGMLACMAPGGDDAPAAYAWQAVVAVTKPLQALPDPELQVCCLKLSRWKCHAYPERVLHSAHLHLERTQKSLVFFRGGIEILVPMHAVDSTAWGVAWAVAAVVAPLQQLSQNNARSATHCH